MINFKCEQLTITDDPDFGCTIEFSGKKEIRDEFRPIEELLKPNNQYLQIQRTYPEDEDEIDWYTIESSESDTVLNQLDMIIIDLNGDSVEISWSGDKVKIELALVDKEIIKLKKTFKKRFKDKVILLSQ